MPFLQPGGVRSTGRDARHAADGLQVPSWAPPRNDCCCHSPSKCQAAPPGLLFLHLIRRRHHRRSPAAGLEPRPAGVAGPPRPDASAAGASVQQQARGFLRAGVARLIGGAATTGGLVPLVHSWSSVLNGLLYAAGTEPPAPPVRAVSNTSRTCSGPCFVVNRKRGRGTS